MPRRTHPDAHPIRKRGPHSSKHGSQHHDKDVERAESGRLFVHYHKQAKPERMHPISYSKRGNNVSLSND